MELIRTDRKLIEMINLRSSLDKAAIWEMGMSGGKNRIPEITSEVRKLTRKIREYEQALSALL